jgi:hypothetical protein
MSQRDQYLNWFSAESYILDSTPATSLPVDRKKASLS